MLLALLLTVGVVSILLLTQYSDTVNRVFRENYKSVVYGQTMKDAIDELASQSFVPQLPQEHDMAPGNARAAFERNLDLEARNITVPGEREAVADLSQRWHDFLAISADLTASSSKSEMQGSQNGLRAAAVAVKTAAQRIINLNLDNILDEDGQIRRNSVSAKRTMYLLLGIGVVVASAFMAGSIRAILVPVTTLTQSVREIERGNLDLLVKVNGSDEIGELAKAFSSMATKLRETRRSDHYKILRAQHTTQLALDSLPDAVAIVTPDGSIDLANQIAQRLFNLRPGAPIENQQIKALYRQVLEKALAIHPKGYDMAIHVVDDQERFFLPHALPIIEMGGQLAGVTLVLVDVTALRRLDEIKSNLLAVVSHELRTPLTGLRMATHLLLDEKTGMLSNKQAELALTARDEANRLHTIIEGLLNISRLESGHDLMELVAIPPVTLATSAVDALQARFRDKGVTLGVLVAADLPLIMADPVRIQHVFGNLLGNALTYTPSGGKVAIAAQVRGAMVEFRVDNTGPAIPQEHQVRIFERFYRVPGQPGTGAGLGLAIAKEIIQAHGGRIWVDGSMTSGAVFCFTIPMQSLTSATAIGTI